MNHGMREDRPKSQFERIVEERRKAGLLSGSRSSEYMFTEEFMDGGTNRFDFAVLAAHRARELNRGSESSVDRNGDSDMVTALREIRDGKESLGEVRERLIESKRGVHPDESAEI